MATKIVDFEKWCKLCAHWEQDEAEDPCWWCLDQPVNDDSTKPVYFKEKEDE